MASASNEMEFSLSPCSDNKRRRGDGEEKEREKLREEEDRASTEGTG